MLGFSRVTLCHMGIKAWWPKVVFFNHVSNKLRLSILGTMSILPKNNRKSLQNWPLCWALYYFHNPNLRFLLVVSISHLQHEKSHQIRVYGMSHGQLGLGVWVLYSSIMFFIKLRVFNPQRCGNPIHVLKVGNRIKLRFGVRLCIHSKSPN